MNLLERLQPQLASRPEQPALVSSRRGRDEVMIYGELAGRVAAAADRLARAGIGKGDRVVILGALTPSLYVGLLGIFHRGAAAVVFDPSAGRDHVTRCVERVRPKAFLGSPKAQLLRVISPAVRRIPVHLWLGSITKASEEGRPFSPEEISDSAEALLTFTSGSTGQPKCLVRTHGFLLAQNEILRRHLRLVPGETDLATLPVFVLANLAAGLTTVLPEADLRKPGAIDPEPVLAQCNRLGATRTAASPAFLERLLDAHDSSGLQKFRSIYTGGAPVFPGLLQRLFAAAPTARIEAVYGSSEAEPIAHLEAGELDSATLNKVRQGGGLPAGQPIPEIDLRIIPDQWGRSIGPFCVTEFDRLTLGAGAIGEIVVAGPHVLPGYLDGVGNEETKFKVDGSVWHRTGDAGCLDADGRLWLHGRCAARINDARGVLYPFAVEAALADSGPTRRCAFIARDNKRWLVLETRDPRATKEGQRLLREQLQWAGLDRIVVLDAIPVDARHNAKIDYPALRRALNRN